MIKSKYIFTIFIIFFLTFFIENNSFAKVYSVERMTFPNQLATQAFYPSEKNKNSPVILLIPDVGQGPKDYKIFSQNLASEGYNVLSLDLSNYKLLNTKQNFDPVMTEKIIAHISEVLKYSKNLPEFKNATFKNLIVIGVKFGATTATAYAARNKSFLISIHDPTAGDTLPEGLWKNFALFIYDKKSLNAQYYNHWINSMNAQEGLSQLGKKPFYKQWITVINMPLSIIPTNENYDKFKKYNNLVIAWLQKYK
jgi:hypothetical protein